MSSSNENQQSEEIQKFQRIRRNVHKNINQRILSTVAEVTAVFPKTNNSIIDVQCLLDALNEEETRLKSINNEIEKLIEDPEELEREMDSVFELGLKIKKGKIRLTNYLKDESKRRSTPEANTSIQETQVTKNTVKLPQLKINVFSGDPLEWEQFKDTFEATIDKNDTLSNIEKFTYLKSYLDKSALQAIEGFPLTSENYKEAMNLLENRYGNPQLIISSHMNKIINLEAIKNSNVFNLRTFYDNVEGNVRALKSVKVNPEHFGPLLMPIILDKLPNVIKLQISRKLGKDNWDFDQFLQCINTEITARESYEYLKQENETSNSIKGQHTLASGKNVKYCCFCKSSSHYSDKCTVIENVYDRRNFLKNNNYCFNCLKSGHMKRDCKVKIKCYSCRIEGNHNTALCENRSKATTIPNPSYSTSLVDQDTKILLQTADAMLINKEKNSNVKVKVLFDSCSQQTYITEKTVSKLKLKPTKNVRIGVKAFGSQKEEISNTQEYTLSLYSRQYNREVEIKALCVPTICLPISNQCIQEVANQYPMLNQLKLADEGFEHVKSIDILVGADYYWNLVTGETRQLNDDGLHAINSTFGWLINGPINSSTRKVNSNVISANVLKIGSTQICSEEVFQDTQLNEQLKNFWSLESIGITQDEKSIYEEHIDQIEYHNNQYTVKLPFKDNHPYIPDNFNLSLQRLKSLRKRLIKKDELKRYDSIIKDQIERGIIERVEEPITMGNGTYLPHREVIDEQRATTKLRIVFDCSAKGQNKVSLNDTLYKEMSLSPLLFDLFIKFRLHRVAITSDISQAYLRINIHESHKDFLRFLWYDDVFEENSAISRYRFRKVLFGASPSQFLLNAVIRTHAEKYEKVDPEFAAKVRKHFYVDDLNTGTESTEKGIELYKKMKINFLSANLTLSKWRTNDENLRNFIRSCEHNDNINVENRKVLGIKWNEKHDTLMLGVSDIFNKAVNINPTKRNILSIIASVFNPIGYIEPEVIKLKILFHEICESNISWDEVLPDDLLQKWKIIVANLKSSKDIEINRQYFIHDLNDPIDFCYLHGFCDSSTLAYGTCVYIKYVTRSKNIGISLVAAKSRIAPIKKKLTIPKLELLGAYILSLLINNIFLTLSEEIFINNLFCWSDSNIALSWIKNENHEYKTFVQNRVLTIRKNVQPNFWHHVRTNENPADVITRIANINLQDQTIWWNSSKFLYDTDLENQLLCKNENIIIEGDSLISYEKELHKKKNILICNNEIKETAEHFISKVISIKKYSSVTKLLNITAYVLRFINNLKRKCSKLHLVLKLTLSVEEINFAKELWLLDNQQNIEKNKDYESLSKSLQTLKDERGLIRVKGRIENSMLQKYPILLDRTHLLTELIVKQCHETIKHCGEKLTLIELRKQYWIVRGKSYVKSILHRCVICKKINSRPYAYPSVAPLPSYRIQSSPAFTSIGIDYFGPLTCKNVYINDLDNDEFFKCYGVIYTCAVSRGIVLDLVPDANADSFILSLSRFISRRGCPKQILTDNGSVFKAIKTQNYAVKLNISWRFNIEEAPWSGGIWERLIGDVKRCLKKSLSNSNVSYVKLQTLFLEMEHILNSRPLCEVYDDEIENVLTPAHLLYGRQLNITNVDCPEYCEYGEEINKRKEHIEQLLNYFWNRWSSEYLASLREYKYNMKNSSRNEPCVNDIVLIFEEKQPRSSWRLGKIIELNLSRDEKVRSAKVLVGKTRKIINRPINRLYPVETAKDFVVSYPVQRLKSENENDYENKEVDFVKINKSDICRNNNTGRPKRNAAVIADLKRQMLENNDY